MTRYKILRPATEDEIEHAHELNRMMGLKDDVPDVPSIIIEYECPSCKEHIETIWLHPDGPMMFTTNCCEAFVVFEPCVRESEATARGKTHDEMTPEEQTQLHEFLRGFYRARPDITARLRWIPRFLKGYAEYKREHHQSSITRESFLGLVVTVGLRRYEPPPTMSKFELGRQADRVVRLGLESVKDDREALEIDEKNLQLIQTMSNDIEGYEFLTRIGVFDPGTLWRKRPRKSIPLWIEGCAWLATVLQFLGDGLTDETISRD